MLMNKRKLLSFSSICRVNRGPTANVYPVAPYRLIWAWLGVWVLSNQSLKNDNNKKETKHKSSCTPFFYSQSLLLYYRTIVTNCPAHPSTTGRKPSLPPSQHPLCEGTFIQLNNRWLTFLQAMCYRLFWLGICSASHHRKTFTSKMKQRWSSVGFFFSVSSNIWRVYCHSDFVEQYKYVTELSQTTDNKGREACVCVCAAIYCPERNRIYSMY